MSTAENKAVFLSYASPAFALALRRGKQRGCKGAVRRMGVPQGCMGHGVK